MPTKGNFPAPTLPGTSVCSSQRAPVVLLVENEPQVRDALAEAFGHVGLDWKEFVKHDVRYERPAEVELLIGDPGKAKAKLGWEPKTKFKDLVRIMVDADIAMLEGRAPEPELGVITAIERARAQEQKG